MFKKYLSWVVLVLVIIGLVGIGIKMFNSMPDYNPYNLQINKLETELIVEKRKTDSLDRKAKHWEQLYIEESKKPKKIIIKTNEKVDSIKHLPVDSALKYFQQWSKLAVPRIPE